MTVRISMYPTTINLKYNPPQVFHEGKNIHRHIKNCNGNRKTIKGLKNGNVVLFMFHSDGDGDSDSNGNATKTIGVR